MKEDRNILRNSLKEGTNEDLLSILRKNKKKLDLPSLQIELRKVLNKLKGKTPSQSSIPQPSQQNMEKSKTQQGSKSNIKPNDKNDKILERSPEPKQLPPASTGKREDHKENDSPQKKKVEKQPQKKQDQPAKKLEGAEKSQGEKMIVEKKEQNGKIMVSANEKQPVILMPNQEKHSLSIEKSPIAQNEKASTPNEKQPLPNDKGNEKNIKTPNAAKQNLAKPLEKQAEKAPEKIVESQEKKQVSLKKMDQLDDITHEKNEKYETPSFKAHQQATFRPSQQVQQDKKKMANVPSSLIIKPNADAVGFIENNRATLEKQVDNLLSLNNIHEFCGEKIDLFRENDVFNIADMSLPIRNAEKPKPAEEKQEKPKKTESLDIKPNPNIIVSPTKSEKSLQSNRGQPLIRPSVLKTIKFITERPNFNPKIVMELQRTLGIGELPPEVVFDRVIGDVHLSRTSKTYFKYKIEVVKLNSFDVNFNWVDRFWSRTRNQRYQ